MKTLRYTGLITSVGGPVNVPDPFNLSEKPYNVVRIHVPDHENGDKDFAVYVDRKAFLPPEKVVNIEVENSMGVFDKVSYVEFSKKRVPARHSDLVTPVFG